MNLFIVLSEEKVYTIQNYVGNYSFSGLNDVVGETCNIGKQFDQEHPK